MDAKNCITALNKEMYMLHGIFGGQCKATKKNILPDMDIIEVIHESLGGDELISYDSIDEEDLYAFGLYYCRGVIPCYEEHGMKPKEIITHMFSNYPASMDELYGLVGTLNGKKQQLDRYKKYPDKYVGA